ncbi:hypothetical protein BCR44DRAFT_1440732 [Catenaria anguillulae PL171]|uniref:Uncharacterized protein n=1 Tax=Catenaria anguillulae PL171 TaxID=765915 RepID=A0A1Y2HEV6_9FUNG|nr:hypothetical protein BCR44DRAFT_1440732 [Catenaria anguillulae PL171]
MSVLIASSSAGVLFTLGDLFAQFITLPPSAHEKPLAQAWDRDRTARMATIGVLVNGPYFVNVYKLLDRIFPLPTPASLPFQKGITAHVLTVPPYLALFLAANATISWYQREYRGIPHPQDPETGRPSTLTKEVTGLMQQKGPTMFMTGFLLWPWVNTLNFRFFTGNARVVVMNSTSLCWNSFLSWYLARQQRHSAHAIEGR